MKNVNIFSGACLFLLASFLGNAQEDLFSPEIITDRPDETEDHP